MQKLLKPAAFVEKQIVESILENRFVPGDVLPAERTLSRQLGVTRPTLRESLHRLAKEGWVTIQHGKPTRINDYLVDGGLGVLHSLVRHGTALPDEMVAHLLEVRMAILPGIAQKALENNSKELLAFLCRSQHFENTPALFAEYDWQLQIKMVTLSGNPVFNMIYNDFKPLYEVMGKKYFENKASIRLSKSYYKELISAIDDNAGDISGIVKKTLKETRKIWLEIG